MVDVNKFNKEPNQLGKDNVLDGRLGHLACPAIVNQPRVNRPVALALSQRVSAVVVALDNTGLQLDATMPHFAADHVGHVARCLPAHADGFGGA